MIRLRAESNSCLLLLFGIFNVLLGFCLLWLSSQPTALIADICKIIFRQIESLPEASEWT